MSARFKQASNWLALLALISCGIVWPAVFAPPL
jgi:hypothetical protein